MKLFLTIPLFFLSLIPNAQETKSQFIYAELAGNARHLSVNYDARFGKKQNGLGFQVGIGGTYHYYGNHATVNTPLGINYLLGKQKHYAVIGAVAIPEYNKMARNKMNFRGNANLGYRYVRTSGFMLQANWNPEIIFDDKYKRPDNSLLWFGIGAGIKI